MENSRSRTGEDRGPPFCRNGQGHPVFGMRWCDEKGFGRAWPGAPRYEDGRYDPRADEYPAGSSYERAHEDFHQYLDRRYGDLAARRPLDLEYQIRLRMQRAAEHDRWHERVGAGR